MLIRRIKMNQKSTQYYPRRLQYNGTCININKRLLSTSEQTFEIIQ